MEGNKGKKEPKNGVEGRRHVGVLQVQGLSIYKKRFINRILAQEEHTESVIRISARRQGLF